MPGYAANFIQGQSAKSVLDHWLILKWNGGFDGIATVFSLVTHAADHGRKTMPITGNFKIYCYIGKCPIFLWVVQTYLEMGKKE